MSFSIAKFGGTSMATAEVAKKSVQVLKDRPEILVCVISATAGSTKFLQQMAHDASQGLPTWEKNLSDFKSRHLQFMGELNPQMTSVVENYCARVEEILRGMKLLKEASLSAIDELVSHGELISSHLFAQALKLTGRKVEWVDARGVMKTSSDFSRAIPHLDLLKKNAQAIITPLMKDAVVVTQGYIGTDLNGRTTTLGKEGSDYSTALFAEALEASEVQIWKDVAGVMTTDPRLVSNAQTIEDVSFDEISELTRFGAKVIHPDTFLPAMRAKIPVYVGYSQNPQVKGTRITLNPKVRKSVRAVSLKKDQSWLTVTEEKGQNSPFFILNVLNILNKHKITPTLMNTSENRLGFVIDKIYPVSEDLLRELSSVGSTHLTASELIAVIGIGISHEASIQGKILEAAQGSSVLMTSGGASESSFCILLEQGKSEEILKNIHTQFWGQA